MKQLLHFTIILSAGYGLFILLGISKGHFTGQQLLYYTILSNLLIFAYYLVLSIHDLLKPSKETRLPNLQGAFTLMISITGLVYHFLLAPQIGTENPYGIDPLANTLVHSYVPLAVIIDWIFFVSIPNPKRLKPLYWLNIPLGYWLIAIIYASFKIPFALTGKYYAYFFIDINQLGFTRVLLNILLLSTFFLVLGYLLRFIKQWQGRP